ncbi:alpha/beta fold hydrolase [Aminipila sp.]|uniref:alpha/beta fold hydrolase n=1 Tax=Aminipila sp. TaxID=2060095 RepID=UPI00289B849E|nr:alpha/beta hydrolase [Aminipila sp.]
MKEYFINTAKHMLRYHDFPGEDMPILFIHGLGCAGSFDYPEVAAEDSLKSHRCILVDLLGAGYSDKPDDFGYTVEEHAEYLEEFVDYLQLETFILFGHSLGGAVALSLANKCKENIHQIILSESNLDKSSEGVPSKRIASYDMNEFICQGYDKLINRSRESGNEMWAAALSTWSPKAAYLISKSAAEGAEPSWREILYSLECSRTFIYGEYSLPDPDRKNLEEQGVMIEIVKGAGHSMAWENPQGLAKAIKRSIGAIK